MPSGTGNTSTGIFCRTCGYDLRAQPAPHRCPECGSTFDPANPRTFFCLHQRGALWRWTKRATLLLLSVTLMLAMCWGWLYRDWKNEQVAVTKLRASVMANDALGGEKLKARFGSAGWVLDRAAWVKVPRSTTNADLIHIGYFKRIQTLGMIRTQITDTGMGQINRLTGLQVLYLYDTPISDAGLVQIKDLTRLRVLGLGGTRVTGSGLVHLKEFKELEFLSLYGTPITDADLAHLTEFKKLQILCLSGTQVTDAGLVHLKKLKSLEQLDLRSTTITAAGISQLRAALPEAKVVRPRS